MDEQERENQSVVHENSKQNGLRKALTQPAIIIGVIALVFTVLTASIKLHDKFFTEPTNRDIGYSLVKYEMGDVIIYSGQISNKSSYHAKEFLIRGKFSSKILANDVEESSGFEKRDNNQNGAFAFYSKRFLGGHQCKFYIMVDPSNVIKEKIIASWGEKGRLELLPQESDENVHRWFELWGKASALSRHARQKRFESNAKHIR